MTVQTHEAATAESVRRSVQALAPEIAARAPQIEAARGIPPDLMSAIVDTGCLRLLLPPSHGGIGADLPAALAVLEELSRADASVGWVVAIGASAWRDLAGLPRASFDELYAGGPDTFIAGVFAPAGTVSVADGTCHVVGRWAFASGCEHARWIYANCLEHGPGAPTMRIVAFERSEVVIEDTWHALGLRGTGSHHIRVDGVAVPLERSCAVLEDEPSIDTPLLGIPTPSQLALELAAVALGVARGAIDHVLDIAGGKVPLLSPGTLATDPLFQAELSRAESTVSAARALVVEEAERLWRCGVEGAPVDDGERGRARAAAAWAVEQAAGVVLATHRLCGSAGVDDASPAARRLRDACTITQHFLVRPATMTTAGALLAGQPIDVPVF